MSRYTLASVLAKHAGFNKRLQTLRDVFPTEIAVAAAEVEFADMISRAKKAGLDLSQIAQYLNAPAYALPRILRNVHVARSDLEVYLSDVPVVDDAWRLRRAERDATEARRELNKAMARLRGIEADIGRQKARFVEGLARLKPEAAS